MKEFKITISGTARESSCWQADFYIEVVNNRTGKGLEDVRQRVIIFSDGVVDLGCNEGYKDGYTSAVIDFLNMVTGEDWLDKFEEIARNMKENGEDEFNQTIQI